MKIFHLSITSDEQVSLWDTAEKAKTATGETYIALQLTPRQEVTVRQAAARATHDREGKKVR